MKLSEMRKAVEEIFGEDMEQKVRELLENGEAKTEREAIAKLLRENRTKKVMTTTIKGVFLNTYERTDGNYTVFIATKDGIKAIRNFTDKPDTPEKMTAVEITEVDVMENVLNKTRFYNATGSTEIKPIDEDVNISDYTNDFNDLTEDGLYLVEGEVRSVFELTEQNGDGDRKVLPVVEDDTANVRLIINTNKENKTYSVVIRDRKALEELCGTEILPDTTIDEIRNMLFRMDVVIFGRYVSQFSNRDNKVVSISRFGFVIPNL